MSHQNVPAALSRRGFLQSMGALTGAAFLPGLSPLTGKAVAQPAPFAVTAKIGLLLPASSWYPQLGAKLTAGFRLGLSQATSGTDSAAHSVVVKEIANARSALAAETAELVTKHGVDLVIGVTTPSMTTALRPVLTRSRTPFIAVETGANVARAAEHSPYLFYNTLGYWQANWAIGQWAARNLGSRAFIASSFYDSGYDALHTFQVGFEAADGQIAGTSVTHVPPSAVDWSRLAATIRQARPDFVFGLYSGELAEQFLRAYADTGLASQIPLLGSAFLVDEVTVPTAGAIARGVKSALSWAPDLASHANQTFTAAYRTANGQNPDAFALLGYDTAQLVIAALRASGGAGSGDHLAQALQSIRWSSPRGVLQMEAATHSSIPPLYLREVVPSDSGVQNHVLSQLEPVPGGDVGLAALRQQIRTGWLNAYLHP